MAYIPGILGIEKIIRPHGAEELLCLTPHSGGKAIIFDLESSMKREGLCAFIKECEAAKTPVGLEGNGALNIPVGMNSRFEFFREFYGLNKWVALGVEILQTPDDKKAAKEEKKEDAGTSGIKKIDEPPPVVKKPAPKTFKKIEAMPLRTVPAGIVWIADSKKPGGPKKDAMNKPLPLSDKLGGHKVGFSRVGMGMPAAGLKSLGGFGGMRR